MSGYGGRDLMDQRKKAASHVHARYAKFGEQVVTLMMQYAIRPNGLQEAAKKLQIQFKSDKESHLHDLIARFLHERGVASFLQCIAPKSAAVQTPGPAKSPDPNLTPAPNPNQTPFQPPVQGPVQITVDRRSGIERRQQPDRRQDVEVITKNSRFGGDRRSGADRRKKQIPPPWTDKGPS
jgi:hypothetical protein